MIRLLTNSLTRGRSNLRWFSTTTSLKSTPTNLTTVEEKEGVRWVSLNNPSKRNVLSLEMMLSVLSRLEDDNDLRCIVLRANGPVFSAGHDLQELASLKTRQGVLSTASKLMIRLRELPVPIVAQVAGPAVAAGVQLMASCDIVVATDCSTFSTPGANVGVFCTTPGVAVSRSANLKTSAFMLLTGKSLSAEEALRGGLITLSCPRQDLDRVTNDILKSICSKSKPIVSLGKRAFYEQINYPNIQEAYGFAEGVMFQNLEHPDGQEGIRAFSSKQKPKWTHTPL